MHDYISYDEALEERIRADREIRLIIDTLGSRLFSAWRGMQRRRIKRSVDT
jgi:hypothetical protein